VSEGKELALKIESEFFEAVHKTSKQLHEQLERVNATKWSQSLFKL
jgi:hypothetical protein